MNTKFNNRNHRYLILLSLVSIFSALTFVASYKDIQSVFANPQVTMMDQGQMQKMMAQMNKTGMMMGPMMMGPMMMGPMMMGNQTMMGMMPCMMMGPMMMGNQTMMGMMPCMMMGMGQQWPMMMNINK